MPGGLYEYLLSRVRYNRGSQSNGSRIGSQSGSGIKFNSENRNRLRTIAEPPPESVLRTEPGSDLIRFSHN
jgi:hypothetical protein